MIDEPAPAAMLHLTVSQFAARLNGWFLKQPLLKKIAISGEVSDLKDFGNGHCGFTLKEEQAVLDCVLWASKRRDLPPLQAGASIVAVGSIGTRPERSGYRLLVDSLELTGQGDLFLLYERLKRKFQDEGLFEDDRKRRVPELPRRVALISARGKAMQDFIETIERNVPFVEVAFIEARVQGLGAEIEIAAAIDDASKRSVDVIVLTRGGGSYEDLFPFNLEPVVRAIVRAGVPVFTAIGHSGDHHLADEVADRRFGTPSLAAESIAKGWILAVRRLRQAGRDLERAAHDIVLRGAERERARRAGVERAGLRLLAGKRAALTAAETRLDRWNPQRIVADSRGRLMRDSGRLETAAARLIAQKAARSSDRGTALDRAITALATNVGRRLERTVAALDRVDPLAPLARGYAIVMHDGNAVRDAASLAPGQRIEARLERGTIAARVESVREDE